MAKGTKFRGGTTHGYYVPPERQEVFRLALRKLQRRRPGKTASEVVVDVVIDMAAQIKDIPGLDDLPVDDMPSHVAAAAGRSV